MEFDYFSVEAILSENQKLQCTFKQSIPGMGHIGGGSERNVCHLAVISTTKHCTDRGHEQDPNSNLACLHHYLFVSLSIFSTSYLFMTTQWLGRF